MTILVIFVESVVGITLIMRIFVLRKLIASEKFLVTHLVPFLLKARL